MDDATQPSTTSTTPSRRQQHHLRPSSSIFLRFEEETYGDFDDALRPNRLKQGAEIWYRVAQGLHLSPPTVRFLLDLRLRCENDRTAKGLRSFEGEILQLKKRSSETWLASRSCFRRSWIPTACGIWHQGGFRRLPNHPPRWVSRIQSVNVIINHSLPPKPTRQTIYHNCLIIHAVSLPMSYFRMYSNWSASTRVHEPLQSIHDFLNESTGLYSIITSSCSVNNFSTSRRRHTAAFTSQQTLVIVLHLGGRLQSNL